MGDGRNEDPVRAQVVQGPVVGDVPDAEELQPDEVAVEQPADPEPTGVQAQPEANPVRRSTRASKGKTTKYKDFVLGDEAQD